MCICLSLPTRQPLGEQRATIIFATTLDFCFHLVASYFVCAPCGNDEASASNSASGSVPEPTIDHGGDNARRVAAPGAGLTLSVTGRSKLKSGSSRPEGIAVRLTDADLARVGKAVMRCWRWLLPNLCE